MTKLISKVSPLTKAIIWLTDKPIESNSPTYKAIDYLLNGLLTSSLNANSDLSSRVLIGEQFGNQLHVFITHEVQSSDLKHFLKLFENDLTTENNILCVDDISKFEELIKYLTPGLRNNIVKYQ